MMSEQDRFRIFGTTEPGAESRTVLAGPLSVELEDGNLRTIRFLGHEVLRGISFLIRDRDWGTCAPVISDLEIEERDNRFDIGYTACFSAPDGAVLTAHAAISGTADGTLSFHARFSADRDFETARAGFTVLHPLRGVVGQPVTVEHGDGSIDHARWPDLIEPWQPFKDIRAITHGVTPGMTAETRFSGDIFEMEDQRNWTDGSYKTYVRPLALPWPYPVKVGEDVHQGVTLTIRAESHARPLQRGDGPITLEVNRTNVRMPPMGIALRPECAEAEKALVWLLGELHIAHLVAHFDPLAGHGQEALDHYAAMARESGLPLTLELALPCRKSPREELQEIAKACRTAGLSPDTLFVSPSVDRQSTPPGSAWPACPPLTEVYAAARAAFPGVRLGGGMMSYFTELNRKRVPADQLDYISHCTNPVVHAADDLSVLQSFEALSDVVRSVRAIWPDTPYRIGPSTIGMRQNPYGSATKGNPDLKRIPMANVDPRHHAGFGALFATCYAATVAPAGLELLTLATLAGPFGLVAGPDEPAQEGTIRPLAGTIGSLARLAGLPVETVTSSEPESLVGLACPDCLILANITAETKTVILPPDFPARQPFALEPYGVSFLYRMPHAE